MHLPYRVISDFSAPTEVDIIEVGAVARDLEYNIVLDKLAFVEVYSKETGGCNHVEEQRGRNGLDFADHDS
jgi:hypothetical protein